MRTGRQRRRCSRVSWAERYPARRAVEGRKASLTRHMGGSVRRNVAEWTLDARLPRSGRRAQADKRRTEPIGAGGLHRRVVGEDELHAPPLDAFASPVDDADLAKAGLASLVEVLDDDRGDVPRGEVVQIDGLLDGHHHRLVGVAIVRVGGGLVGVTIVGVALVGVGDPGGRARAGQQMPPGRESIEERHRGESTPSSG